MKKIFIFALFCFVAGAAFGQFPANPNKIRLGNQTSGDGLVYRGSGAPAYTPSGVNNAWVYIDSVAGRMYTYRGGAWEFVSAGAGVDSTAFRNDSLFIYSPDTTFFVVIDRTITVAGTSGTPQTVDPGETVTIAAGNGVTTTAGATRTVTVAADTSVLASKTYLTNALVPKLNISDTAAMLAPYQLDITNPVTGTGTSGKVAKFTGTSSIGNGIASDDGTRFSLDDASTSTAKPFDFDSWTTAARPGVPSAGDAGWNTSNTNLDIFDGTSWFTPLKGNGTSGKLAAFSGTYSLEDAIYYNTIATDHNTPASASLVQVSHGTTNAPVSYTQSSLAILGPTRGWQLFFSNTDGWVRQWQSGYANWRKLWMDSNDGAGSTLDADLLDGISSDGFFYATVYGSTFDVVNPERSQIISSTTSSPYGNLSSGLHIGNTAGQRGFQFASDGVSSPQLYFRNRWSSAYSSWQRIITGFPVTGNIPFWGNNARTTGDTLANNANFFFDNTNTRLSIGNSSPARTLHVTGEARITDLTTDTPTRIVGADADGDLGALTLGTGVTIDAGVLNVAASAVSDGDKGDVDVTSSGATWTIDTNAVTLAKMQTISTNRLLGNDIGSAAVPSQLIVGNGIQLSNSGVRLGGHRVYATSTSATVTSEIDSCGQLVVLAVIASGASADLTITLPNASSSYLGREVLVYADDKDDDSTGGADYNVIVTTTSGTFLYYGNGESGLGLNASYEIDPPATPTYVKLICVIDTALAYKWVVLSY